jgi:uncharacterized protein (DUF433 family)
MVEVSSIKDWENQLYNIPIYSIADAARYLHIPAPTLKTWLTGRSYSTKSEQKKFSPLIQRPNCEYSQLSFTNLIEAHVLRVIRTVHNIPLDKVRIALDYISEQFNTNHPLVQKQFNTDGIDLFIEQVENLINVSRSGQLVIRKILKDLLTRVEWDEKNIASRLYPFIENIREETNHKILTIDPKISFGKPTITGTGVPTKIIAELYDAGDAIQSLADDYNCNVFQIEQVILFESNLRVA